MASADNLRFMQDGRIRFKVVVVRGEETAPKVHRETWIEATKAEYEMVFECQILLFGRVGAVHMQRKLVFHDVHFGRQSLRFKVEIQCGTYEQTTQRRAPSQFCSLGIISLQL